MQTTQSLDAATDRVVRNVVLAGLVPALIVGVALFFVHPIAGAVGMVLVAGIWSALVAGRANGALASVVTPLGAAPLAAGSHPRLENLLEGLCATAGVASPEMRVVESEQMNALVAADRERTVLVMTSGLIDGLGRIELEGAVANLLGRQRDGSARYSTMVTALFGPSGIGTRLLLSGLGGQRSVHSDMAAVDMTRYPPGLISALAQMERTGTLVAGAPQRSIHLWLAPPMDGIGTLDERLASTTMQPLTLRIAVLEEL